MATSAYHTAFQMTTSVDLQMRVAASAQQEGGASIPDVEQWARDRRWDWATQADWIAAVQAAIETGITSWATSPTVITDQHILSYVQAAIA